MNFVDYIVDLIICLFVALKQSLIGRDMTSIFEFYVIWQNTAMHVNEMIVRLIASALSSKTMLISIST